MKAFTVGIVEADEPYSLHAMLRHVLDQCLGDQIVVLRGLEYQRRFASMGSMTATLPTVR